MRRHFCFLSITMLAMTTVVGGCSNETTGGTSNHSAANNAGLEYPELYTSANLPQYPGATLQDVGRQTTSIRDGLALTLQSSDDPQTVAAYYAEKLEQLGWQKPPSKIPPGVAYPLSIFIKGDLRYQLTITRVTEAEPTKIRISYLQK